MRKTLLIGMIAALCIPGVVSAQANVLQSGLNGRTSKLPTAAVERDGEGRVKAGYYRLAIVDSGSGNAATCPRVTFNQMPRETREAWRSTGGRIASEIFDRNVSWTITAAYQVATPVPGKPISSSFRLARIDNAEKVSCEVVVGDKGAVGHRGFLIPINRNLNNFGAEVPVTFNINYSSRANKERITQLWSLGSYLTSLVVPGAVGVLEQAAPAAEQQIDKLLDESNAATSSIMLSSLPDGPQAYYVDLGFFHEKPQAGQAGNHGLIVKLEYVASVFLNDQFLRPITRSGPEILKTNVRRPEGDVPIRSLIRGDIYDTLLRTDNIEVFSTLGQTALEDLVKAGLSEIDATVFIAEIARANPNFRQKLSALTFLADRNYLLEAVKKTIPDPPPPTVEAPKPVTQAAQLEQLHKDMEFLGAMLQSQNVGDNLSAGFADIVALYVEEPFRSHLGMTQATATLPKRDALELLIKGFDAGGCFAPRVSRRELLLGSRVPLLTLAATDRVGALALKVRVPSPTTGTAAVMTFVARGYAAPRTASLTDVIAITAPRAYQDNVLSELSDGRRPASCNEEWMNPIFAAR